MHLPLPLRLTLFYALLLALALWLFGWLVYTQAAQRAYGDLDTTLMTRATSVRLGKDLLIQQGNGGNVTTLPSVDGLGTHGVNIEVLDETLTLLASTTPGDSYIHTTINGLGSSPVPWDSAAAHAVLRNPKLDRFTTITYMGQRVRVYTLANTDFGPTHIIQTAHTEQDIEQALSDLRQLLLQGAAIVLLLALLGGWLISRGALVAVQRITRTARQISASRDFSQRVPSPSLVKRDELATLTATFNQMLASLQDAYQRQQRFVADASHELRAPVTSIRCNLDLLARAPDLPPDEMHAALDDARAEAERIGRLINDLLQLARFDNQLQSQQDGQLMPRSPVDLDSLLLEVFRQYRPPESETHPRGPRLLLQRTMPAQVRGDADQLKQALVALLDNALKYTPQEGSVTLALTVTGNVASARISDTGIGISSADLPHIFERFYRADPIRTRDRGGSGLGLAIVQSIVHEHGGTLEVASTPGKGSTFTVVLPLIKNISS